MWGDGIAISLDEVDILMAKNNYSTRFSFADYKGGVISNCVFSGIESAPGVAPTRDCAFINCEFHAFPKRRPAPEGVVSSRILDRPWFKLVRSAHLGGFVNGSSIRIGTVEEYRHGEHKTAGVSDYNDAQYEYDVRPSFLQAQSDVGADRLFLNCRFRGVETIDNCYVFCASLRLDERVRASFPDYDAVVEICSPRRFIQIITKRLRVANELVQEPSIRRCEYSRYPISVPNALELPSPAFIKHIQFKRQAEVRCVWQAGSLGLVPAYLQCPEVAACCAIHKL